MIDQNATDGGITVDAGPVKMRLHEPGRGCLAWHGDRDHIHRSEPCGRGPGLMADMHRARPATYRETVSVSLETDKIQQQPLR